MQRLFEYLTVTWLVITANFFLPRVMPGDVLLSLTGEAGGDVPVEIEEPTKRKLRQYYELDASSTEQYLQYLCGIVTGDLGYSVHQKTSVLELLQRTLPWTLLLTVPAICFAVGLGTGLGVLAAWGRGSAVDRGSMSLLVGIGAVPSFLVALGLHAVFAVYFGAFPVSGAVTTSGGSGSWGANVLDVLWHSTLPILALTIVLLPEYGLLVRNSMINALGADYVFVARLKGLPEWMVMFRHAMRSALLPLVTHASLRLSVAVGGMIFIESVFSYPGMGNLLYRSLTTHDYAVTQGILLVIMVSVLSVNFFLDTVYRHLDPRLRSS